MTDTSVHGKRLVLLTRVQQRNVFFHYYSADSTTSHLFEYMIFSTVVALGRSHSLSPQFSFLPTSLILI
jgi:hypothetical protein